MWRWMMAIVGAAAVGCSTSPPAKAPPPAESSPPPSAAPAEAPSRPPGLADLGAGLSGLTLGSTGERPVLIAIHGRGDHPLRFRDMVSGWADVAEVVVPAAPIPYGSGFSWFNVRASPSDPSFAASVAEAARQVVLLVNHRRTEGKPVVVTGFSQGGILSFALAVQSVPVVDAAAPMGGFLPKGLWPDHIPDHPTPILAVHGEADDIIPVAATRASVDHLESLGWPVRLYTEPGVRHTVTATMRREVDQAIRQGLVPPAQ
jgi:phospholipase/carboxylesterase